MWVLLEISVDVEIPIILKFMLMHIFFKNWRASKIQAEKIDLHYSSDFWKTNLWVPSILNNMHKVFQTRVWSKFSDPLKFRTKITHCSRIRKCASSVLLKFLTRIYIFSSQCKFSKKRGCQIFNFLDTVQAKMKRKEVVCFRSRRDAEKTCTYKSAFQTVAMRNDVECSILKQSRL